MRGWWFALLAVNLVSMEPDAALERLQKGNQRYVEDLLEHPDRTSERRSAIVAKQNPFAVVLGCSDSRVAPEIVFDQGVGDLFVVRVAGNVAGPIEIDSIEYAVEYLNASLIVVLGHQHCGAVDAVMQGKTQDIEAIAEHIRPAIAQCAQNKVTSLDRCVKENVLFVTQALRKSSVIQKWVEEKKVRVVGGYYCLETGKVEWMD